MLELLEYGNVYSSGGKVVRKGALCFGESTKLDLKGGGRGHALPLVYLKKRFTVQPFRVKLLLEVVG